MKIEIGNNTYEVTVANTDEARAKGLQGVSNLSSDQGMLFIFDEPQTVGFWMEDTTIPLDIIFIGEDEEVISVYQGEPYSTDVAEEDNVKYVLEVNQGSGITEGDELYIVNEDDPTMKVLFPNGEVQMELDGGERIFSRKNTKTLIKKAKKAEMTNADKDYKALGKAMFGFIKGQDNRDAEYVELKS